MSGGEVGGRREVGRSKGRKRGEKGEEEEGERGKGARYVGFMNTVYGNKFDVLLTTDFMYRE